MTERKTHSELLDIINAAYTELGLTPSMYHAEIWRHTKTGQRYIIRNVALNESDLVPMVVYSELVDMAPIFVRPVTEFLSKFEVLR